MGAPSYFASHGTPTSPRELLTHRCVDYRHRGESVYKWELDKGDEPVAIAVGRSLILDDDDLVVQAAIDAPGWRSWPKNERCRTLRAENSYA